VAAAARPVAERSATSFLGGGLAAIGYIFMILPTLIVIPLSFNGTNEMAFPPTSPSFAQYALYFGDGEWLAATFLSTRIATMTALLSLAFGLPAAYGLVRGRFPGRRLVSGLLLGPALTPIIVVALGLFIYFSSLGLDGATLPIVLGHTLIAIPFVIVTAMSGLRHVDANLEVAGMVMGDSRLNVFRKITLPLLRPSILASGLFAFLISFDEVIIAFFLGRAGQPTLAVRIFASIQWEISPVIAAISTILTVLSLVVCLLAATLLERQ
jgi:putative spermidine/putrescine transport system permease protein